MDFNYLDFLEKIKGKSVDEINVNEILKKDINYDLEMVTVTMIMDDLVDLEQLFDSINDIVSIYMEKSIIFFNILKQYTTLKINEGEDVVENYNIVLEEALKRNYLVNRCYKMIEKLNNKRQMKVIELLSNALKEIPDVGEVEEMTNSFKELFSNKNEDKLKLLDNIVSYNDPSMKALKEVVYDSATDALIKAEDINKQENNK